MSRDEILKVIYATLDSFIDGDDLYPEKLLRVMDMVRPAKLVGTGLAADLTLVEDELKHAAEEYIKTVARLIKSHQEQRSGTGDIP